MKLRFDQICYKEFLYIYFSNISNIFYIIKSICIICEYDFGSFNVYFILKVIIRLQKYFYYFLLVIYMIIFCMICFKLRNYDDDIVNVVILLVYNILYEMFFVVYSLWFNSQILCRI